MLCYQKEVHNYVPDRAILNKEETMATSSEKEKFREVRQIILEKLEREGERCIEPKNSGPRLETFFEVVSGLSENIRANGMVLRPRKK